MAVAAVAGAAGGGAAPRDRGEDRVDRHPPAPRARRRSRSSRSCASSPGWASRRQGSGGGAPKAGEEKVTKAEAEDMKKKLEEQGATVSVK